MSQGKTHAGNTPKVFAAWMMDCMHSAAHSAMRCNEAKVLSWVVMLCQELSQPLHPATACSYPAVQYMVYDTLPVLERTHPLF